MSNWSLDDTGYDDGYKDGRAEGIEEFMLKAITKFYDFDVEHGYPTHEDVKDILLDVANELKGEQNGN